MECILNTVLVLSNLRFGRSPGEALIQGLNLEMNPGDRVGLSGHNGCGKSTLLQIVAGLIAPGEGSVELFGCACRSEDDFRPLYGRLGLLFQDSDDQLFCPTVEEDIAFGPLNQGCSRGEVRARVDEVMNTLNIASLARRPIGHLSGGQKRLVALAGLLAMRPELLLLDEPDTGLDPAARERLIDVLGRLPQAMLVVSHDRLFLRGIAGRCYDMEDGCLHPRGAPTHAV